MVSKMTLALQVLSDGEWHSMEELRELVDLDEHQAEGIVSFLNEYDFAARDSELCRVRLTRCFQDLLCETLTG